MLTRRHGATASLINFKGEAGFLASSLKYLGILFEKNRCPKPTYAEYQGTEREQETSCKHHAAHVQSLENYCPPPVTPYPLGEQDKRRNILSTHLAAEEPRGARCIFVSDQP